MKFQSCLRLLLLAPILCPAHLIGQPIPVELASPAPVSLPSAAQMAAWLTDVTLDPQQTYRVRDLNLRKDDIRLYFNDGYLMFLTPVNGKRIGAIFTGLEESGDGEVLLFPPGRAERESLAKFTGSPNLDEHFSTALLLFTDGSGEDLLRNIGQGGRGYLEPEASATLLPRWVQAAKNVVGSMNQYLVASLLSAGPPEQNGFFYATVTGKRLGMLEVLRDPHSEDTIVAGQMTERGGRTVYDVWTGFPERRVREGGDPTPYPYRLSDHRIQATIDGDLFLSATTRATLELTGDERAFLFAISPAEEVTEVRIDGKPVELLKQPSELRRAMSPNQNDVFLAVAPEVLRAGSPHQIEFDHQGTVIRDHGHNVYSVDARLNWYPGIGLDYSKFDLEFRYPSDLTLVTPGKIVEERQEEGWRITRRVTDVPIRVAGFNLGRFSGIRAKAGPITVDVYGNRGLDPALVPRPRQMIITQRVPRFRASIETHTTTFNSTPTPPDPLGRLKAVAEDVSASLEFFTGLFGPPAMDTLTVSPIPGTSGQGFPGLIYLSTLSYLEEEERPEPLRNIRQQVFYSDLMVAHEVAHQWWGNVVAPASYRDDWIVESLAEYSGLLWLEHQRGGDLVGFTLDDFRHDLLEKTGEGTVESFGPLTWGYRLNAAPAENTSRIMTYEKGTWIFHMLRQRLGDENFFKLLTALRTRHQFGAVSTEQLQELSKEFLPEGMRPRQIDLFFENWVYGTGIPKLELDTHIENRGSEGAAVSGSLRLRGKLADGFSVEVPVEFRFPGGATEVRWFEATQEPVEFRTSFQVSPQSIRVRRGAILHAD